MKTKLILSLCLVLAIFTSCNEKDMEYSNVDFDSQTFVVFSSAELSVNELVTSPIEIEALYASSSSSALSLSVPFTITGDAVEGVDYMIMDNKTSFDFSPTDLSDSIFIMPIDNLEASGDKLITISFNSGAVSLGYPGPDGNNKSVDLTIVDNDCPYTLQELADASWSGSDNSGGEGDNASQITMSYDGTTFFIEGISYGWLTNPGYWDEVIITSNPLIANVDLTTSLITIDLQDLCTTTWIGAPQPAYSLQATGNYDSCSETMTLNWDLIQGGGILRSYTETITK